MDPSFLAALPEDIRREVLQNQLGIRPPSRPPATTTLPSSNAPVLSGPGVTEVSPEFLAALPPTIQEEVRKITIFYSRRLDIYFIKMHGFPANTRVGFVFLGSCPAKS